MDLRRILAIGVIAATAVTSLALAPVATADHVGCDRDCKIEAANKYLAALVSHDGSDVPFHPDAWRQENGGNKLEGGEKIREALSSPIMYVITGIQDLRWYVQGDDAMAVYFLDTVAPTYIFERFRVDDDGLITEIDAHFYIDIPGHVTGPESVAENPQRRVDALFRSQHGPAGPVPVKEGDSGDTSGGDPTHADVGAAVTAFLDAMVSGEDVGNVIAEDVAWTVNHRVVDRDAHLAATGASVVAIPDDDLEESVTADTLGRYIQVDGDQATLLYHLVTEDGGTLYAASRIAVDDAGQIVEIESVCDGAELCI